MIPYVFWCSLILGDLFFGWTLKQWLLRDKFSLILQFRSFFSWVFDNVVFDDISSCFHKFQSIFSLLFHLCAKLRLKNSSICNKCILFFHRWLEWHIVIVQKSTESLCWQKKINWWRKWVKWSKRWENWPEMGNAETKEDIVKLKITFFWACKMHK